MRQMTLTGPNVTLIPSSSQNTPPHTAFTASATYSVTKGVSQPAAGGDYQTCGTGTWTVTVSPAPTGEAGPGDVCGPTVETPAINLSGETPSFQYHVKNAAQSPSGSVGPFHCVFTTEFQNQWNLADNNQCPQPTLLPHAGNDVGVPS